MAKTKKKLTEFPEFAIEKREVLVMFRVTKAEKVAFEKSSQDLGINRSDWLRMICRKAAGLTKLDHHHQTVRQDE